MTLKLKYAIKETGTNYPYILDESILTGDILVVDPFNAKHSIEPYRVLIVLAEKYDKIEKIEGYYCEGFVEGEILKDFFVFDLCKNCDYILSEYNGQIKDRNDFYVRHPYSFFTDSTVKLPEIENDEIEIDGHKFKVEQPDFDYEKVVKAIETLKNKQSYKNGGQVLLGELIELQKYFNFIYTLQIKRQKNINTQIYLKNLEEEKNRFAAKNLIE